RDEVPVEGLADEVGGVLAPVEGAVGEVAQGRFTPLGLVDSVTAAGVGMAETDEEDVVRARCEETGFFLPAFLEELMDVWPVGKPGLAGHPPDAADVDLNAPFGIRSEYRGGRRSTSVEAGTPRLPPKCGTQRQP